MNANSTPPRLFPPAVSAALDSIAGAAALPPLCIDAAALTVLAGTIGRRVVVAAPNGGTQPLSLLTALLVSPINESRRIAPILTKRLCELGSAYIKRFGETGMGTDILKYATEDEKALKQVDPRPESLQQLQRRRAQAEFALSGGMLLHDPSLANITTNLQKAHDRSMLVCLTHNHLIGEFGRDQTLLAQFLGFGVNASLYLREAPKIGYAVSSLAVMQRGAVPILLRLRSSAHEPVPFMVTDAPAQFGAKVFAEPDNCNPWFDLTERFFDERLIGAQGMMTMPADAHLVLNDFLQSTVDPIVAANPAVAPFLAHSAAVVVRTSAVLTLASNVKATEVSPSSMAAAASFCSHWIRAHAAAIAACLPKPVKRPRLRPIVMHRDLGVDRALLIDHVRRRAGHQWRDIKMNLPRGRGANYWEERLSELKQSERVAIGPRKRVTLKAPPVGVDPDAFYSEIKPEFPDLVGLWNGPGG